MPSNRAKIPHLVAGPYTDVETAVKELGSLWVLDLINKTLSHTKSQRERIREVRASRKDEK